MILVMVVNINLFYILPQILPNIQTTNQKDTWIVIDSNSHNDFIHTVNNNDVNYDNQPYQQ